MVAHDRQLVEQVADRVLWVEDGAVRTFDQGLARCQRVLAEERSAARAAEAQARERAARAEASNSAPEPAREIGKIRNPLLFERLEQRIIDIESDLESLRAQMLEPDNYASATKMKALQADETRLQAEIVAAYEQWEDWQ